MPADADRAADIILVGGGLANGLLAYRLAVQRPDLRLLILEGGKALGGNHTWSFHEGDVGADQRLWLRPLIAHRWAHYDVMFDGFSRRLHTGYCSVTSDRFHHVLCAKLGAAVRLRTSVETVHPTAVGLSGGQTLLAGAVIDGRGFRPSRHLAIRYQKFLGLEVKLAHPHGLAGPIIMDATVPQLDGYRFVYVLPFAPDRLLIEDTYYSDGLDLDAALSRERALAYAADRGWAIEAVIREERGVSPIALRGDIDAFWQEQGEQPRAGLRAALFHPTTGYSLPQAVRLADMVAALADLSAEGIAAAVRRHAAESWKRQRFFRGLSRMLFLAGRPEHRHRILRRFYGFPEGLISRFYAGELSTADKLRIVTGRPPVPFFAGLRAFLVSQDAKV